MLLCCGMYQNQPFWFAVCSTIVGPSSLPVSRYAPSQYLRDRALVEDRNPRPAAEPVLQHRPDRSRQRRPLPSGLSDLPALFLNRDPRTPSPSNSTSILSGRGRAPVQGSGLFALCRPQLSHTRALGRYPSSHRQFHRCLAFGNTLGPEEAYRFARGEEVVSSTGQRAKLSRPLDFLVVADHAEGFGFPVELRKGNPLLMTDPTAQALARPDGERKRRGRRDRLSIGWRRHDPQAHVRSAVTWRVRRVSAGLHRDRRTLQRTGPLHRLDRLRVDLEQVATISIAS